MNKTGIKEQVLLEIRDLADTHHIQRVLLFGSRARGDFSPGRSTKKLLYEEPTNLLVLPLVA